MDIKQPYISSIQYHNARIDLLRLDIIHPLLSGNKYYKLISHQSEIKGKTLITLGGAYSNHLHASAWWAHSQQIPSIGLVRGEEIHNPTLKDCTRYGMQLKFIPRSEWDLIHSENYHQYIDTSDTYFIDLGGRGGNLNAFQEIAPLLQNPYDEIYTSVGTGTTFIGISPFVNEHTTLIGYTKVKDKGLIKHLHAHVHRPFEFIQLGGFGKITSEIRSFIIDFYEHTGILLDPIYTAPMIQYICNLEEVAGKKIMAIHTGGIQGMRSDEELLNKFGDKLVF